MIEKVSEDGKIAVLVSPDFGSGWSTESSFFGEELCMDADLVRAIQNDDRDLASKIAREKYGACVLGLDDVVIEWVPIGTKFQIREYDGFESLHILDEERYFTA